jgi:hypothetical protein
MTNDSSMPLPTALTMLGQYLAGEFSNHEQALAEAVWFVDLRLWHRPVSLFTEDSVTIFAEQANVHSLDNPYRQRLLRLRVVVDQPENLSAQYYSFKNPDSFRGVGQQPERLQNLTLDQIEELPGCVLNITCQAIAPNQLRFIAAPPPNTSCYFTYQNQIRQVILGFESSIQEFLSFDKGVEVETGKALWGAMMGPYRFIKQQDYELL